VERVGRLAGSAGVVRVVQLTDVAVGDAVAVAVGGVELGAEGLVLLGQAAHPSQRALDVRLLVGKGHQRVAICGCTLGCVHLPERSGVGHVPAYEDLGRLVTTEPVVDEP